MFEASKVFYETWNYIKCNVKHTHRHVKKKKELCVDVCVGLHVCVECSELCSCSLLWLSLSKHNAILQLFAKVTLYHHVLFSKFSYTSRCNNPTGLAQHYTHTHLYCPQALAQWIKLQKCFKSFFYHFIYFSFHCNLSPL